MSVPSFRHCGNPTNPKTEQKFNTTVVRGDGITQQLATCLSAHWMNGHLLQLK